MDSTFNIFTYNPTDELINKLDNSSINAIWKEAVYPEHLYSIESEDYDKEVTNFVHRMARETETITLTTEQFKLENTNKLIQTNKNPDKQVFIDDITENPNRDIIGIESPGGDIRKYINYEGRHFRFSTHHKLFFSDNHIRALPPLSIRSVRKLIDRNVLSGDIPKNPQNPTAAQVSTWSRLIEDQFGLKCGILCNLYFNETKTAGRINGFVIYNADEEVRQWCDQRWRMATHANVFIQPDQYSLTDKDWTDNPIIRMYWE